MYRDKAAAWCCTTAAPAPWLIRAACQCHGRQSAGRLADQEQAHCCGEFLPSKRVLQQLVRAVACCVNGVRCAGALCSLCVHDLNLCRCMPACSLANDAAVVCATPTTSRM